MSAPQWGSLIIDQTHFTRPGQVLEQGSLVHTPTYVIWKTPNYYGVPRYYATQGLNGKVDFEDPLLVNVTQPAINNLNSLGGGRLHFKGPATYDYLTGQPKPIGFPVPSGLPGGCGMILYPNINVSGDGKDTILTTSTPVPGSPTANDYFAMFVNNDYTTNDGFINIRDLSVVLPPPSETSVGMQAWDDTIVTYGMHDSTLFNVYTKNGGYIFLPNSIYLNTVNALSLGQNFNNTIAFCMSENQTINTGFFQGTNSWFVYNRIFHTWDDAFIIASAGTGHKIIGNIIDGGEVTNGKGAASGLIYLQNDGAVGAGPTSGVLANNLIAYNTCKNHLKNSGSQTGIYELGGRGNRYIENDCFSNAGFGLFLEQCDHSRVSGGRYYLNTNIGVRVLQDLAGTLYDVVLDGLRSFDNGTVGAQQSGINIGVTTGNVLQDLIINNCTTYDDQGGITQLNGISFNLDGNLNTALISGNNVRRQSNPISIAGAGVFTGKIINNPGYNPFGLRSNAYDNTNNIIGVLGTSSTLTSTKVYTCQLVPLDLYLAGGTVSSMTKNGSAIPYNATLTFVHLEPGDTWSITFSVIPTTNLVFGQ